MKILGISSVDFDVIGQLQLRYSGLHWLWWFMGWKQIGYHQECGILWNPDQSLVRELVKTYMPRNTYVHVRSRECGQYHNMKIINLLKMGHIFNIWYAEVIYPEFDSAKACCLSVQTVLSVRWLPEIIKSTIYRNIILPVVLYGCEM